MTPATVNRIILFSVFACASALLGGCANAPPPRPVATPVAPTPAALPAETAPLEEPAPTYAGPWEDPSNPLHRRTIYFDYDNAEIQADYLPVLRNHAQYIGATAGLRVMLEGHTDERGSRDYNLALGEQRADAVRRFMLAEGVRADQLETLSYGEERPANAAHDEAAWRQNRRVFIAY